jgi:hypothetical protein
MNVYKNLQMNNFLLQTFQLLTDYLQILEMQ